MKIERGKNTKRNIVWGTSYQILNLLLPFACRTLFIYVLGKQYLGISNLFVSVLSVLNLAELGIGSAMSHSMYKPVATDDTTTICALMNLYKKLYRMIGTFILVAGVILLPTVPRMVSGEYPSDINLYIVYLIELICVVISYFLFAHKRCLLTAIQRNDVSSKINAVLQVAKTVLQILILVFFPNYYLYIIVTPALDVLSNIIVGVSATKMYPQYRPKGTVNDEVKKELTDKVKGLFLYKMGYTVTDSVDSIVISSFLGVSVLGVYSNYLYIMTSVYGFITIIYNSVRSGIGNYMVTETLENNYKLYKKIFFMQQWLVIWCCICFVCLYQDFICLWIGRDMMLPIGIVIMFAVYFFTLRGMDVINLYKEAAGMWNQDKLRPLINAITNLIMNIIMVRFIGLYGILLSTIVSTAIVSYKWASKILFREFFKCSERHYLKMILQSGVVAGGLCAITYGVCALLGETSWLVFIMKGLICVILPNILYAFIYRNSVEILEAKEMLNNVLWVKKKQIK